MLFFTIKIYYSFLGVVQKTFYNTSLIVPYSLNGKLNVIPYTLYSIKVETVVNDMGDDLEKVSAIRIDNQLIGSCNPNGIDGDCGFFNCGISRLGDGLTRTTIQPTRTVINFEMVFSSEVNQQLCTCNTVSGSCGNTRAFNTLMSVTARVTLTPENYGNISFITL